MSVEGDYKVRIVIASGKGGTGKTFISTNLAYSLGLNKKVQLIDCDVEEPNSHIFIPVNDNSKTEIVRSLVPVIDNDNCCHCGLCAERCQFNALSVLKNKVLLFTDICHSCGGCILSCPNNAITKGSKEIGIIESYQNKNIDMVIGKLKVRAIQAPEVINEALAKQQNNYLTLVDAPPGTSCTAIAAVSEADFCVLVSEPTPFGLHDLELAVDMVKALNVKVAVVINKYETSDSLTERYCKRNKIPVIAKIPQKREIAEAYASGKLITEVSPKYQLKFQNLYSNIERMIKK